MNILKQMASDTTDLKSLELDEKLEKALREDRVNPSVVIEELKSIDDDVLDHSKTSIRARLERILESTPLEIFLVVLVIADVVILLVMLLLDLNVLHLHLNDSKSAAEILTSSLRNNCIGNTQLDYYEEANLITVTRLLEHEGCQWDADNTTNTESDLQTTADHNRHKRAVGPTPEGTNPSISVLVEVTHALHIASVVILAVMVVEVLLKIFALRLKYFKGKLEVVDGIVIIISFTLDLYFIDGVSVDSVNNGATLLVILLLWRILRVFNALLVTAKKRLQFRIRVQKRMRKVLEDKIEVFDDDIKNLEIHIENLNRLAKRHNLPDYEVKACKPLVRQMSRVNTNAGLASMMQMSMGLMHGMNNMKLANKPKSSLAETLKNPPTSETTEPQAETVSEVLSCAMAATEKSNRVVDVLNNPRNNVLPASIVAAVATGSTENSPILPRPKPDEPKQIPSIQFAQAVGTGKPSNSTNSNGVLLRSWSDSSDNRNNSSNVRLLNFK